MDAKFLENGELLCPEGCGVLLSAEDAQGHCCVDALRALVEQLQDRGAALEHEVRLSRLRWDRKEQLLVARATTAQYEAKLAAIKYQRRLHQYILHVSSITQQVMLSQSRTNNNDAQKPSQKPSQESHRGKEAESQLWPHAWLNEATVFGNVIIQLS